jgi:hypothetical protein
MHRPQLLPSRYYGLAAAVFLCAATAVAATFDHRWLVVAGAAGILSLLGVYDVVQTRHAILRNYPVLAHIRFFFETIRPEIRQYLLEADNEAVPFSRAQRSLVYQRAKGVEDRQPFGTGVDVYLARQCHALGTAAVTRHRNFRACPHKSASEVGGKAELLQVRPIRRS